MRKKQLLIIAALAFLLALALIVYPVVSTRYNEQHQSEIHTSYQEQVKKTDTSTLEEAWARAEAYNRLLASGTLGQAYTQAQLTAAAQGYDDLLNITGSGCMGYVTVPSIQVTLPIYHGTEDDALRSGAGHILGTSLPIGGESTHAVLSAHTGTVNQKMFTDLDQVREGEVFYLEILGRTLAYQVDQIKVVVPYDTTDLQIEPDLDYCTLVTCTPYGVNSHRLLVRGHRIPYEKAETIVQEQQSGTQTTHESTWETQYLRGLKFGTGLALVVLLVSVGYVLWQRRKKAHG